MTKKLQTIRAVGEEVRFLEEEAFQKGIKIGRQEILEMFKKDLNYAEERIRYRLDKGAISPATLANDVIGDLRERNRAAEMQVTNANELLNAID